MATYEVLIEYDELTYYPDGMIRGYDRQNIYLDQVDNITINATSDLTTHPMLNGDLVSDHIIKKPITVSFGGTFSTNGSTKSDLIQKQTLFENIKNNGWFCHISKINRNTNKPCFIKRNNLVLTSIQWTEGINYVTYSFTFSQVFVINEIGYSKANIEYLPETIVAGFSNFDIGSQINDNELYWELLNIYYEKRVIDRGLYSEISTKIVYHNRVDYYDTTSRYETVYLNPRYIINFNRSNGDAVINFSNLPATNKKNINAINKSIEELIKLIKEYLSIAYQFKFTKTGPQTLMMNVADNYYVLNVKRDGNSSEWLLTLSDLDDVVLAGNKNTSCKVSYYSDMNDSNYFYKSANGLYFYVWYVRNPKTSAKTDLTQYSIVVTPYIAGSLINACNELIQTFINNLNIEDYK